jgi:hypothetical protein
MLKSKKMTIRRSALSIGSSRNELGQPFTLMDHRRDILRLAYAFDENGRLPWDTIL